MDAEEWFRVTYVSPSGVKYETTNRATSAVEAVRLADETLEYVERIGISDYLSADGMTVRPPAQLRVERIGAENAMPGFGVVITLPDGTVERE